MQTDTESSTKQPNNGGDIERMDMQDMNVEQIGIHAESINAGHLVVVLEPRRTLSPVLVISAFERQGYMLELKDPVGYPVWSVMLNGEDAVGGQNFPNDTPMNPQPQP